MDSSIKNRIETVGRSKLSTETDRDLNRDFEEETKQQRFHLRGALFWSVIGLMFFEVAAMFLIVFFQGFGGVRVPFLGFCEFQLEQWTLAAFEAGVLVQTFMLARIITLHLFPNAGQP